MKTNESNLDRIVRVVIGLGLIILYYTGIVTGGWGTAAIIVGAIAVLTGIIGFCPIYALLKISTKKE
ncbi:MAG: DUF2892 domain-containing protein [Flexilinea sp.]